MGVNLAPYTNLNINIDDENEDLIFDTPEKVVEEQEELCEILMFTRYTSLCIVSGLFLLPLHYCFLICV